MKRNTMILALILLIALGLALSMGAVPAAHDAHAAPPDAAAPAPLQVRAITAPCQISELGFTIPGKIKGKPVQPGKRVKTGDLLVQLDDEEGKALVDLYTIRANSDLAIKSAKEQLKLATIEAQRIEELRKQNVATIQDLDRANTKQAVAQLDVEIAQQQRLDAELQLRQTKAKLEQYYLKAPTDGFIEETRFSEGEAVESLKPVIRLVVTDRLWVDAPVPMRPQDPKDWELGSSVTLVFDSPAGQTAVGKIIFIRKEADAASATRVVRVEVENPGNLPAGEQVTVIFPLQPKK